MLVDIASHPFPNSVLETSLNLVWFSFTSDKTLIYVPYSPPDYVRARQNLDFKPANKEGVGLGMYCN